METTIRESFLKLKTYCEEQNYKGWDPFDGLNSKIFQHTPVKNSRLARLAWIQLFKRNPINLRSLALVEKGYNPKALGLFLSGYCNLYHSEPNVETKNIIEKLSGNVISLVSKGYSGSCWGYNFDWQARAFFQPKSTPTVVATSFISSALLDAYEILQKDSLLNTARSSCNFILKDLNRTYDKNNNFVFSYSPLDQTQVYNASLLGSRLLSRVYSITNESLLIEEAEKSVKYCCNNQNDDGSWSYGSLPFHRWIDNFHTGYNLECLFDYMKFSGDKSYQNQLKKGFEYFIQTFFTADGVSKYYNNSVFPIDIHAPAQLVITLVKLGKFTEHRMMLDTVLEWTIKNMQSKKGYFYYQINKYFSSRIPYIRWAQAWMFYALTQYLLQIDKYSQENSK